MYLHSGERSDATDMWTGRRQLKIKAQRMSNHVSPFSSVSGVHYNSHSDEILLSLSDGQVHVISQVFTNPAWDVDSSELTSNALRSVFMKRHTEGMDGRDLSRVFGMASYDEDGIVVTAHE